MPARDVAAPARVDRAVAPAHEGDDGVDHAAPGVGPLPAVAFGGEPTTSPTASDRAYGPVSAGSAERTAAAAFDLNRRVRAMLLPEYRRAVDALDRAAAAEQAAHLITALRASLRAARELDATITAHAGRALSADVAAVLAPRSALALDHQLLVRELVIGVGPQTFRGQPVIAPTAPRDDGDLVDRVAREATAVLDLLATIATIQGITGSHGVGCPRLDDDQRERIAALVEAWHARPVDYAFLAHVLATLGVWDEIAAAPGPSGRSLQATLTRANAQAGAIGALADVGAFDSDEAARLLPADDAHQRALELVHDADGRAATILDRIRSATPPARGAIVRHLAATERLDFLCTHLPWRELEALYDAILPFDRPAAGLLFPYVDGKGGGESLHQLYLDAVDDQLEKGHSIRAGAIYVADAIHDAFTGGFHHDYAKAYDAHARGETTDDAFADQTALALGKSAVTSTVGAAGGFAGAWVEGVAAPLGAGASVIGGAVGGFAAGTAGHFAGDVYDQVLRDKRGFDSLADYAKSGVIGGIAGATVAMVGSLGAGASRRLAASAQRCADLYAARFPRMTRYLDAARRAGVGARVVVQTTVAEALELVATFGRPGGPDAAALAGLPADAEATVAFTALADLDRPAAMMNEQLELPLSIDDVRPAGEKAFAESGPYGGKFDRDQWVERYERGQEFNSSSRRWRRPDARPVEEPVFAADATGATAYDELAARSFGRYAKMLERRGIATKAQLIDELASLRPAGRTHKVVRHALKGKHRAEVMRQMTEPTAAELELWRGKYRDLPWASEPEAALAMAKHREMIDITGDLASADKGTLAEEWYGRAFRSSADRRVDIDQDAAIGMARDRTPDLIDGSTIREVKAIAGRLDERDLGQFGDNVKLVEQEAAVTTKSGKTVKVDRLSYVFTDARGARANVRWMKESLREANGKLSIEVFDPAGRRHIITDVQQLELPELAWLKRGG